MSDHVELAPSAASRWMKCPASVPLSRGLPDSESDAAAEGTRAHAVAEYMLNNGGTPPAGADPDMIEYVREFYDFCLSCVGMPAETQWRSEQKLTLDLLNPPGPMRGTADFICRTPLRLDIVDLKYGQGVYVDVTDNPQLLYYAAMGLCWCQENTLPFPPEIRITIVQPRIEHRGDTVRSVSYTLDDVLGFSRTLLTRAEVAMSASPNDPSAYAIGDHCRWCKALPACPAQRLNAEAIAQQEFSVITPASLPAANRLSSDELGGIMAKALWLGQWVKSLEAEADARLSRGELVPGWKLAPKQGRRKWIEDAARVESTLLATGLDIAQITKSTLCGVGDVERALKRRGAVLPAGLTTKESSGFTLVPDTDRRPSRNDIATSEFTVLSQLPSSTE